MSEEPTIDHLFLFSILLKLAIVKDCFWSSL